MLKNFEVVYNPENGFKTVEIAPEKSLQKNDVLIRPQYVGICGTDLFLMRTKKTDMRFGHEWAGSVVAIGKAVKGFKIGDAVTGSGHIACGKCSDCKKHQTNLCGFAIHFSEDIGALRGTFISPSSQVQKISPVMKKSFVLHEIFGVGEQAYSHVQTSLKDLGEKSALIFGAGPIGLSIAFTLKSYGIKPIVIEKMKERVELSRNMGFESYILAEALMRPEMQSRFGVLIDASNDYSGDLGAFRLIPFFAKKKFTALIVGKYMQNQTLPPHYNSREGQLIWMRGVSNKTMVKSVKKWTSKLPTLEKKLITHTFPIDQVDEAFKMAADKSQSIKVIIQVQ